MKIKIKIIININNINTLSRSAKASHSTCFTPVRAKT